MLWSSKSETTNKNSSLHDTRHAYPELHVAYQTKTEGARLQV